tara:strand:- start:47 stop:418 length:372 start_codon:yes stop_codon:yes gene_type:complete
MEGWRDFLSKASDSSGNKDKEKPPPPSSVVAALMKRAGLSREEAEKQAKRQVDLEEDFDEEPPPEAHDKVVDYIINATTAGQSPDEITQGLLEAGLTEEQALEALSRAFEQGLPAEEVEVDLD